MSSKPENDFSKCIALRFFAVLIVVMMTVAARPQASSASIVTFDVDLAGWSAFGDIGDPLNSSATFDIGGRSAILSIEYIDLNFEAFAPSWISELVLSTNNSDFSQFWDWNPGVSEDNPGQFSGSGVFNNPGTFGSGPFEVRPDGLLVVTVYESFVDGVGPDATISSGTLRITYDSTVPEPSTLAMFCIVPAIVIGNHIRRRRLNGNG